MGGKERGVLKEMGSSKNMGGGGANGSGRRFQIGLLDKS